MKCTLQKTSSVLFGAVRAVLVIRFCYLNGWLASCLAASEFLAVYSTFRGVVRGEVMPTHWSGALSGLLYLAPMLMIRTGSAGDPSALFVFCFLGLLQLGTRFYMGFHLTVATPMFRGLLDSGPFGLVRHPLASLEMLMVLCFLWAFPSAWNGLACLVVLFAGVATVWIEERFLKQFPVYEEYSEKVPDRFIPYLV